MSVRGASVKQLKQQYVRVYVIALAVILSLAGFRCWSGCLLLTYTDFIRPNSRKKKKLADGKSDGNLDGAYRHMESYYHILRSTARFTQA
jgi:hypothetical protein